MKKSNDEHSNALPAHFYGDPALAYERKEGASCKGCRHDDTARIAGGEIMRFCAKGKKHGRKCLQYSEKE